MSRASVSLVVAGLCLLAGPGVVRAQSNEDINSVLQFNFSNPGARSLGMGGAFTARADDATAVYANPAGLIQLSRPEISVEGRSWGFSHRFLNGGTQLDPASFDGLIYGEADDSTSGLSFLSAFYPSKSGRWVAGIFRHETVNFEAELHTQNAGIFTRFGTPGFARPRDGYLDLEIDTLGVSVAVKIVDRFTLGATISRVDFAFGSRLELFDSARDEEVGDVVFNPFSLDEGFPGLTEGDPEICCEFGDRGDVISLRTQQGDDDAIAYTLGLFWESPATQAGVPVITAGAVYRRGPEFDFVGRSYIRSLAPSTTPPTTRTFEAAVANGRGKFRVPTVLGAGVSYRPSKRWVVSGDYARVRYDDLMRQILILNPGDSSVPFGQTGRSSDYVMDDGDEWRLGLEYAVNLGAPLVFLRAGTWIDPDHEIEYVGEEPGQRGIFRPGDDEWHRSLGVGLKFRDFQLDAAIDVSDRIDTFSLSTVIYFGRD